MEIGAFIHSSEASHFPLLPRSGHTGWEPVVQTASKKSGHKTERGDSSA